MTTFRTQVSTNKPGVFANKLEVISPVEHLVLLFASVPGWAVLVLQSHLVRPSVAGAFDGHTTRLFASFVVKFLALARVSCRFEKVHVFERLEAAFSFSFDIATASECGLFARHFILKRLITSEVVVLRALFLHVSVGARFIKQVTALPLSPGVVVSHSQINHIPPRVLQ